MIPLRGGSGGMCTIRTASVAMMMMKYLFPLLPSLLSFCHLQLRGRYALTGPLSGSKSKKKEPWKGRAIVLPHLTIDPSPRNVLWLTHTFVCADSRRNAQLQLRNKEKHERKKKKELRRSLKWVVNAVCFRKIPPTEWSIFSMISFMIDIHRWLITIEKLRKRVRYRLINQYAATDRGV